MCFEIFYINLLWFSNFEFEYLCENKKVRETVLPVHMGTRSNLLSKKMAENSRDTVPIKKRESELPYLITGFDAGAHVSWRARTTFTILSM